MKVHALVFIISMRICNVLVSGDLLDSGPLHDVYNNRMFQENEPIRISIKMSERRKIKLKLPIVQIINVLKTLTSTTLASQFTGMITRYEKIN